MIMGKILRTGFISNEKLLGTNIPVPVDSSSGHDTLTISVITPGIFVGLSEHVGEATILDKIKVKTKR